MALSLREWIVSSTATSSSTRTLPHVRLMDGGVSTHLEKLLQAQDPLATFPQRSLWSSSLLRSKSGQATILQGHKDWLTAGSDILTTVTYQCHFGCPHAPLLIVTRDEMKTMMDTGIQLAKHAIEELGGEGESLSVREHFVVASSGCYGAALANGSEYTGIYPGMSKDDLVQFHLDKITVLAANQPDGVAIETIPCVEEAEAASLALKRLDMTDICCWISLACKDGETLNEGKPIVDALQAIRNVDPDANHVHAVGVNCCDSIHITSLVKILTADMAKNGPRRGIVLYPNSGEEWDASNASWRIGTGCTDADQFSDRLVEALDIVEQTWLDYGGHGTPPKLIIGGCCRTSPTTIAALRRRIDDWHKRKV